MTKVSWLLPCCRHSRPLPRFAGFPFIYDLGSTHGTFLNKRQLEDRVFVRLFTNDSIRFGASSRLFVVQAPPSTTQMEEDEKEQRMRDKIAKLQQKEEEQARSSQADAASDGPAGISWGMSESAPVEDDAEVELNDEPLEGLNDGDGMQPPLLLGGPFGRSLSASLVHEGPAQDPQALVRA